MCVSNCRLSLTSKPTTVVRATSASASSTQLTRKIKRDNYCFDNSVAQSASLVRGQSNCITLHNGLGAAWLDDCVDRTDIVGECSHSTPLRAEASHTGVQCIIVTKLSKLLTRLFCLKTNAKWPAMISIITIITAYERAKHCRTFDSMALEVIVLLLNQK